LISGRTGDRATLRNWNGASVGTISQSESLRSLGLGHAELPRIRKFDRAIPVPRFTDAARGLISFIEELLRNVEVALLLTAKADGESLFRFIRIVFLVGVLDYNIDFITM
jgi:hypothetical protein